MRRRACRLARGNARRRARPRMLLDPKDLALNCHDAPVPGAVVRQRRLKSGSFARYGPGGKRNSGSQLQIRKLRLTMTPRSSCKINPDATNHAIACA
jgi:hypothetical protein